MSRFRRRLMGLAALRQAKADDFVRVEYIENTSYAYIDTLFKPNNKTKIEVSVELVNIQKLQWIYGARKNQQDSSLAILYGAKVGTANLNYGYLRYDFGNKQNSNNNFIENKKWKISNESNVLTYTDGTEENTYTITCANNSFTCNYNLYLFNLNNRNTISNSNAFLGKVYYFKIYNDGELVRDYIPMYQISKDTYGLWDRVTEEFYTSPNGVKFTGGERVIADADENLYYLKNYIYINSTQTQYIILKPFTENDNVELKVHPITATNYWFGDRSASGNQRRLQIASWNNTRLDIARNQFPSITYPKGIINKDITLKLDGKQFYVNNELLYTFTSTLSTTNNTNLGRVYNTGRHTDSRFYWFKWWNKNKDLIYDLIPVQRCSDGVWGFFDKVSLVFHPSDGTTQFTGG